MFNKSNVPSFSRTIRKNEGKSTSPLLYRECFGEEVAFKPIKKSIQKYLLFFSFLKKIKTKQFLVIFVSSILKIVSFMVLLQFLM